MADSADAGNKDHSYRAYFGDLLGIVTGPAGHDPDAQSQLFGYLVDAFLKCFVGQSWMCEGRLGKTELNSLQLAELICLRTDLGEQGVNFRFVQIAQLQTERHSAGDHVVGPGLYFDPAHGPHLPSRNSSNDLVYFVDELGRSEQGVVALVHRSSSCMVSKAF